MKIPHSAIICVLILPAAGWFIMSTFKNRPTANPSAAISSQQTAPVQSAGVPFSSSASPEPVRGKIKAAASIRSQDNSPYPGNLVPAAAYSEPTTRVQHARASAGSPRPLPGTQGTVASLPTARPTAPVFNTSRAAASNSISIPVVGGTSSQANASDANSQVFELDPGVPIPAALVTPEENQTAAAAAAQQRLADTFLEEVDAALGDPATSGNDDSFNEAYFDLLMRANERYRALYGDEAFNRQSMRATMEAIGGS